MMVLSWHSILVERSFKNSALRMISLKPTEMFLNLPNRKSTPKLRRLLKERNLLSDASYLYEFVDGALVRKEKVIKVKSVSRDKDSL